MMDYLLLTLLFPYYLPPFRYEQLYEEHRLSSRALEVLVDAVKRAKEIVKVQESRKKRNVGAAANGGGGGSGDAVEIDGGGGGMGIEVQAAVASFQRGGGGSGGGGGAEYDYGRSPLCSLWESVQEVCSKHDPFKPTWVESFFDKCGLIPLNEKVVEVVEEGGGGESGGDESGGDNSTAESGRTKSKLNTLSSRASRSTSRTPSGAGRRRGAGGGKGRTKAIKRRMSQFSVGGSPSSSTRSKSGNGGGGAGRLAGPSGQSTSRWGRGRQRTTGGDRGWRGMRSESSEGGESEEGVRCMEPLLQRTVGDWVYHYQYVNNRKLYF